MVTNILDNIQSLHFGADLDEMDEINKEFVDIWNNEDIDELKAFNEKLNVLAEVYRV
ncbi:hypothetical protein SDC9_184428 [bioreactor metagenome]|uniref:Uncharacterized protein n=1 Tax=bioreactor metagenome TaxID=1076179 RepID=A0A645HEF6_9ZZZZ